MQVLDQAVIVRVVSLQFDRVGASRHQAVNGVQTGVQVLAK